jgi:GH25 family lysozyme M1 (1,4-beta-N-acetylmuramidase)
MRNHGRVVAFLLALALACTGLFTAAPATASGVVYGMDVSGWQGVVNWSRAHANGARFAYVKATEGTGYTNPYFTQQYRGSHRVGMIRGAYHFARPDISSGFSQAVYFVRHGGGWSRDGRTLPGALDIEWNPHGDACYGRSKPRMARWIRAFSHAYHARTTRYPVIYTAASWWSQCVGRAGNFGSTSPLWVARYSRSVGRLPHGWRHYTFWQYADAGKFPGDQDRFNGVYRKLQRFAKGPAGIR